MILSPCHLHSCHWLAEVCLACLGCMAGSHYSLLEPISTDGHYRRLKWLCRVKAGEGAQRREMAVTKSRKPVRSHLECRPSSCFCRELNICTCRAAGSNSRLAQKINYGWSWNKLQPFMSSNYTSSVFLVLRCHYTEKSVTVNDTKVMKGSIPL